jgi:hypothetical protein
MRGEDILATALARQIPVSNPDTPVHSAVASLSQDGTFTRTGPRRYALTFFVTGARLRPASGLS